MRRRLKHSTVLKIGFCHFLMVHRSIGIIEMSARKSMAYPVIVFRILILLLLPIHFVMAEEGERIYRTGLEAEKGGFSVSPDGQKLLFETNQISHGLRLIDLGSGKISVLPEENGRSFGFSGWSPDGKWVVVVSAVVDNGNYKLNDMEIVLLEVGSWKPRSIASGEGAKFFPFFSADGKKVYYFKGKVRANGKTPASGYDLYAIDLTSGQETQLTNEAFYQAVKGDETQAAVLFSATPNAGKRIKDAFGKEGRNAIFTYDKATASVLPIPIDQSSGIFDFMSPQRDPSGSLYFIAATDVGGRYHRFLARANPEGKQVELLSKRLNVSKFDIARNTGEIYVMDLDGKELIFRRLATQAAR
jgi:Tol biopolymer transport system component